MAIPPTLTDDPQALQLELPAELGVAPDQLRVRVDFYDTMVILHYVNGGLYESRIVSARDVALALMGETDFVSGLLPQKTLCWGPGRIALWEDPRVWPVAIQLEPFKPPVRMKLPMPGLIFICRPGQPPWVYAAKKRPQSMRAIIYNAPLFNIYNNGSSCPGNHKYPQKLEEIPKSFFMAFFSVAASPAQRSKKYPEHLLKLWQELDGRTKYPMDDLVPFARLEDVFNKLPADPVNTTLPVLDLEEEE